MDKYAEIRQKLLPVRGFEGYHGCSRDSPPVRLAWPECFWQGLGNVVLVTAAGWIWWQSSVCSCKCWSPLWKHCASTGTQQHQCTHPAQKCGSCTPKSLQHLSRASALSLVSLCYRRTCAHTSDACINPLNVNPRWKGGRDNYTTLWSASSFLPALGLRRNKQTVESDCTPNHSSRNLHQNLILYI